MLGNFSYYLSDSNKIHILLPYIFTSFEDQNSKVVATAYQIFCKIAESLKDPIKSVSDKKMFEDYILPNVLTVYKHSDPFVVATFAENLHILVDLNLLFVQKSILSEIKDGKIIKQALQRDDERYVERRKLLDLELTKARNRYSQYLGELLTMDTLVQEKFLTNLHVLSFSLGQSIIPHAISCLNSGNKNKLMSLKSLVSIAGQASETTVEYWLKPIFKQCLHVNDEMITVHSIKGFVKILQLGKISKSSRQDVMRSILPFLIHPNQWIRQEAIDFFCYLINGTNLCELYSVLQHDLFKFLKNNNHIEVNPIFI